MTDHSPLYGPQTQLALGNFPTTGRRLHDTPALISSYAHVKAAAAEANAALGLLTVDQSSAIRRAAAEIADGKHNEQFPLALVQGGGGTSTNMNVNEVIAARANQLLEEAGSSEHVHPNDHVNRSQSTNDTYPTAMALAIVQRSQAALAALDTLEEALGAKGEEWDNLVHLGRTCLRDAVVLTAGQTHRGQAHGVRRVRTDLADVIGTLLSVPLGGTVLGTGAGAPEGYTSEAIAALARITGLPVETSADFFDSLSNLDPYSAVANAIQRSMAVIAKIAADIRLLSSGPHGGIGEITIPALQAGSSIMPGKVNPVIPELVMQLSYRVRGSTVTVDAAVAAGELDLNVMEPVIFDALDSALSDLADGARLLAEKCVAGLSWNLDRVQANARGALDELVAQAAHEGYQHVVDSLAR